VLPELGAAVSSLNARLERSFAPAMPCRIAAADWPGVSSTGELDNSSGYVDGITASDAKCLIFLSDGTGGGGGVGGDDVIAVVGGVSVGETRGPEAGGNDAGYGESWEDVRGLDVEGCGLGVPKGGLMESKDVAGVAWGLGVRNIFINLSC